MSTLRSVIAAGWSGRSRGGAVRPLPPVSGQARGVMDACRGASGGSAGVVSDRGEPVEISSRRSEPLRNDFPTQILQTGVIEADSGSGSGS